MKKGFLKSMVMVGVVAIWGLFSTAYCDHHLQQEQLDEQQRNEEILRQQREAEAQRQRREEAQEQVGRQGQEEVQNVRREMDEAVRPELEANIREYNANPEAFVQAVEADAMNAGQVIGDDMARGLENEAAQVIENEVERALVE